MDTHRNAPLTPKGRAMMVRAVVDCGLSKAAAAGQFNITPKTVAKWVKRFRAEGIDGLRDRSSRPLSSPSQTAPATATAIEAFRRQRYTAKQIAAEVGVSAATVSRILRRRGLNRLSALEPEPIRRYERARSQASSFISISRSLDGSDPWAIASLDDKLPRQSPPRHRLGVRPRLHRRCISGRLQPGHEGREERKRGRISQGSRRLLRKLRGENRACYD